MSTGHTCTIESRDVYAVQVVHTKLDLLLYLYYSALMSVVAYYFNQITIQGTYFTCITSLEESIQYLTHKSHFFC